MPDIIKLPGQRVEQIYDNGVTYRISFQCDRTYAAKPWLDPKPVM